MQGIGVRLGDGAVGAGGVGAIVVSIGATPPTLSISDDPSAMEPPPGVVAPLAVSMDGALGVVVGQGEEVDAVAPVPPPSKVEMTLLIPVAPLTAVGQLTLSDGIGLSPGDISSVAPSGIAADPVGVVAPRIPSGDVAGMPGVTDRVDCARADVPPPSKATAVAAKNNRLIEDSLWRDAAQRPDGPGFVNTWTHQPLRRLLPTQPRRPTKNGKSSPVLLAGDCRR
jgi:hypothetical protein